MFHHLALAHALVQERLALCRRTPRRRPGHATGRKSSRRPALGPRKQRLAENIRLVEHAARARVRRSTWLSRAYYGCCIPSAALAALATTSTLAHHPAIAGSCSAAAAAMTAALACLRGPFERSVADGPFTARFEGLALRARELRNSAPDLEIRHLEASFVRLETDLEMLVEQGGAAHRERDSVTVHGGPSQQFSATAAGSPEGS